MYRKVAKIVEYSSYFHSAFPNVNILHNHPQWLNQELTLVQSYFLTLCRCHQCFPRSHPGFTLHLVVSISSLTWSGMRPEPTFVFRDLNTFEVCWSPIFQNIPLFGFICCFFMTRLRLWVLGKNTPETMCLSQNVPDAHVSNHRWY